MGQFEDFERFARQGTWCELNVSGNDTIALTADRTRSSDRRGLVWDTVAELYSQAVEKLYLELYPDGSVEQWWNYHTKVYNSLIKPIPKALRKQALKVAHACVLDRSGFHTVRIADLRKALKDRNKRVYGLRPLSHRSILTINHLLPENSIAVVWPSNSSLYQHWFWRILSDADVASAQDLLVDMQIQIRTVDIGSRQVTFVDAGSYLWHWPANIRWLGPGVYHGYPGEYDWHSPFSQVLIKWCQRQLPRRSEIALNELFETLDRYASEELIDKQREVVETLKSDGVVPKTVPFDPVLGPELPDHDCPYGYGW